MAFTGFQLLLVAVSALAGLAAVALPVRAADEPLVPAVLAPRIIDVRERELSDSLSPAETPPPDFTSAQYIDSAGCVFLRTGPGWRARVSRDGAPICGYPPTLSARRVGLGSAAALFPKADEPQAERIHRELAEAIIPGLQAGELAPRDDHRAAEANGTVHDHPAASARALVGIPAMPGKGEDRPAQDQLGLGEMLSHAPDLSRQMTRASHTDRLCALIGSTPQAAGDPSLGLCGTPATTLATLAGTATATIRPADPRAGERPKGDGTRQAGRVPAGGSAAAAKPRPQVATSRGAELPRDKQRMIPPGARYVQIGAFSDPQSAERVARNLAASGLPVVRARPAKGQAQLLMVGPLDGRQAIVRMIDRLRRAGYHDVVARR